MKTGCTSYSHSPPRVSRTTPVSGTVMHGPLVILYPPSYLWWDTYVYSHLCFLLNNHANILIIVLCVLYISWKINSYSYSYSYILDE
jgi:hypothetical protein